MSTPKTNAMRILDKSKIAYQMHSYGHEDGLIDGISVARKMGQDPARVYKTLVTQGASRNFYVFVIPVEAELDLKAAARAVGEKNVGMKKQYVTVFDQTCCDKETMFVSGGKIGLQIEIAPDDLISVTSGRTADLILHS